jgi:hypothetical protein
VAIWGRGLAGLTGFGLLACALVLSCLVAVPAQAKYALPVETYASYQPQKSCVRKDRAGTVALGRWLAARGGVYGGTLRPCSSGGSSEHKDGRAFDWMLDAKDADDRDVAEAFLVEAFADDELGDTDALARRMGIMYVIWNDTMYAAWDGFEPKKYLSSGCRTRRTCSVTLRHRDHMHVSLSRAGADGLTSWYVEQALVPTG